MKSSFIQLGVSRLCLQEREGRSGRNVNQLGLGFPQFQHLKRITPCVTLANSKSQPDLCAVKYTGEV
jgi:hypothetical protein